MEKIIYLQIILAIISFLILLKVYFYLNDLKVCDCYIENENTNYKVNVDFLKYYQVLEMVSLILFITLVVLYKTKLINNKKINKNIKNFFMKMFIFVILFVLLFLCGYISYNSLLFYLVSKKNCECSDKWQKYFIYIQGISSSIYFLRLLFILILTIMLILFNFKSAVSKD
tara:strand:- start:966 stop:1478 length:513 start_codon:yes stop_codon:yes gene_type:complete